MNSTSLFNFSYLKENIKKSKAIILLCMILIPIVNGIILLMNCSQNDNFMPSIYELSGLVLFGMYIIPIVLSITLFSFVYKRGSIDFSLSMPISKRQIFLTNSLGGIVVILLMQIINFIITFVISLIYNNLIIDSRMFFDILLICSISYIFVFVSTNIAVSLSSNKITTVIVTLLILFLIPFISTFISENGFEYNGDNNARIECISDECMPNNYHCIDINCEIDKKNNIYHSNLNRENSIIYTMPYELINENFFAVSSEGSINTSLIKMGVLIVIYVFVGLILFERKKFEVVDISFKSEKMHIFVRTLTTIPIICISYIILKDFGSSSYDFLSFVLLIVIIFTYLIVYDLITRKKVTNFFKMAICLIIVTALVVITGCFFNDDEYDIKVKDIEKITFSDENNSNLGYTKNKSVINYVISLLLDDKVDGEVYYSYHIKAKVGKDIYSFNISANRDNYDYINNLLLNDKDFSKSLKKYKDSDIFGIEFYDGYTNANSNNNLYDMIINKFKNNKGIFSVRSDNNSLFNITLYIYDNYNVKTINFDVSDDKDLVLAILRYYNFNAKKYIDNISKNNGYIYSYYIDGNYYSGSYSDIEKFIVDNIDDDIDINKSYSYITMYGSIGKTVFLTNKVDELNLIKDKYKSDDLVIDGETDDDM